MLDALNTLPTHIPLKWLMLFVPLLILVVWHYYQHKTFHKLADRPTPHSFTELLNVASWRTAQIASIWVLALLLIAGQDLRFYSQEEADTETEASLEPLDFSEEESDSATIEQPFSNPPQENKIDDLKFRYEDAFVSFLYLQRCKRADVNDLTTLNDALAKEGAEIGAAPEMALSIFSAAQGSFESIYSDTPCDSEYVEPVLKQFAVFMQKIR